MFAPVADQRILRGTAATLSYQFTDSDGEPLDPGAGVTVGITKADGSVLVAAGAAAAGTGTNARTYALTAANNQTLELLTVSWTIPGGSTFTELVDVVGGYYFATADLRNADSTIDSTRYPPAAVIRARRQAEEECETITGVAWVPRYRRVRVTGSGTSVLQLPNPMLRRIRSARVYADAVNFTALDAASLAAIPDNRWGSAVRSDGSTWLAMYQYPYPSISSGQAAQDLEGNILIEYEHGLDRPPEDIKTAVMKHTRHILNAFKVGARDQATMITEPDGGSMLLAMPGRTGFDTGYPDVDAIYQRVGRDFTIPALA